MSAVKDAIAHLDQYGYCLLPELMPAEWARSFAERCQELHADPRNANKISGDEHYETLFGMLNLDDRTWACASHPSAVTVARHFLGPKCRVVEACSKPTQPGAPHQALHADSAGNFVRVPDIPWMINSMWMLTDFTADNGATAVVPGSHRSRLSAPPADLDVDGPHLHTICGTAGSLLMWHAGTFHMARGNRSDTVRVGLNVAYYPRWFNNWVENHHQPVWPETFEPMPRVMQSLCTGRRVHTRAEAYEAPPMAPPEGP